MTKWTSWLPKWKFEVTRYNNGEFIPRYMGYSYKNWNSDISVFHPIPFNMIIASWRWLYAWMRFRFTNKLDHSYFKNYWPYERKAEWVRGYRAAMQQYGLHPLPNWEIIVRYEELKANGKLEQVSRGLK